MNLTALSLPPLITIEITPLDPLRYFSASAWFSSDSNPGYVTDSILSDCSKYLATFNAFSQYLSIRNARVSRPRLRRNAECAAG